jgi:carbon-monoxide dehydrogenase large subunit
MTFGIGQAVPRKEDPRFLTGRGRYVDDIELPRMSYGFVVRSPHANARIKSIDKRAAEDAPGVLAVLTGDDYKAAGLGEIHCHFPVPLLAGPPVASPYPALAQGVVKTVGESVAFIVANSLAEAKDAAELLQIDYEAMPSVTSVEEAMKPGAPKVWEHAKDNVSFTIGLGDAAKVDAAFAAAVHSSKIRLVNNRVSTNSMEPRGAIGVYDAGAESYTLYNSCQAPHLLRQGLAQEIFHIPETNFRVIAPDVGGGFGMKGGLYPEDILVSWAAKIVGRPVKWIGDRVESIQSDAHGRDQIVTVEMAFDKDARITALRAESVFGVGAHLTPNACITPMFAVTLSSGVYAIPAIRAVTHGIFTNCASTTPYRGAGRPEASYMLERLLDQAAREMKIDPVEIRRRNLIKSSQMPFQTALFYAYDSGDFEAVMDKTLKADDWAGFEARRAESAKRGKLRGRGISCYIESATIFNDRMEIRFDPSGAVTILAGTFSHGQGHETAYAQMASAFLGVDFESVKLIQGDTDAVSIGRGTYGSRSITIGGSALRIAADKIIERGTKIAAFMMEAAEGDIEFDNGDFTVKGTDKKVGITDVAKASYDPMMFPPHLGLGLEAVGDFNPGPGIFPNGCQIAEVEVDPDTGDVDLVRLVMADDVGTVINPLLLTGQLHGGLTQGIGQALLEHIIYDKESGQLLSSSFMDYCMPRADDLPNFETDVYPIPTKQNPLGVKGGGETGTVGAPAAVMNAVADALASRGKAAVDMPATPEKVWRALNAA